MRDRGLALAPACALVLTWWWATTAGPASEVPPDVGLYRFYAAEIAGGLVPYRDFLFEYPPGALAPMVVAGWLGGLGATGYQTAFELLMLAALLGIQAAAVRLGGRDGRAVAWALAALPAAAGAIAAQRLDLLAVLFVVVGLTVLAGGAGESRSPTPRRAAAGLALLGVGTLVKLFPAVVAAVALAWLWGLGARRACGAGAAAFAAVVVVGCLPFAVASPGGFADQATFQTERPVQIESTPASVVRLLGGAEVTGTDERPNAFRSQALEGGPAAAVGAAFGALQLAAVLLAAAWAAAGARAARDGRAARAGATPPGRVLVVAAAAALVAFVALGKVLSPQYLLWLAPLAPLLWFAHARAAAALLVAALVLTQAEFPARYGHVVAGDTTGVLLLGARNGALVAALALLLVQLARLAAPAAVGRSSSDGEQASGTAPPLPLR